MKLIKNQLITLLLFFTGILSFSQVGIGTATPRGALDINSPTTNTTGLVLPTNPATTNIVNPQGGIVAEGTVMFDSTDKCVKFFNGTEWSNCLCDSCNRTAVSSFDVDCTRNGFSGSYVQGNLLNANNTFSITATNNSLNQMGPVSFQASDVVFSGVEGVTVNSVNPGSVYISPGQSQLVTYYLNGTPDREGTLTATFSKLNESCTNSIQVSPTIRFGLYGGYPIGGSFTNSYHQQLLDPVNYGPNGTYSTNRTFAFGVLDISITAQQMKQNYDIISVSATNLNNQLANIRKLQEFVRLGGVLIVSIENSNYASNQDFMFQQFGNTGTIGILNADFNFNTSPTEILSTVFGDSGGLSLLGSSYGLISVTQLAENTRIIATTRREGAETDDVIIWTSGEEGRIIWSTDTDIFNNSTVTGVVDNDQERFIHNLMAYALEKVGI